MATHAIEAVPESEEALNLASPTPEEREDYLALRQLFARAVAQGMEEVRLRQEDLIARGLMDENFNLIH